MTMPPEQRKIFPPPADAIASGAKLVSRISLAPVGPKRVGTISDENGHIRWRYGPHPTHDSWGVGNPLSKPDFVLFEDDQTEAFRIRRISFFPSAFCIMEKGKFIGRIRLASILRNKYEIQIDGLNPWTFHMPLFRVYFYGKSSAGAEFWVAMVRELRWHILIGPGLPERPLAAVLAFIHNERFFYS